MTKKIGVLLSGCGFLDGSEIHEATLTLLFLDQLGVQTICLAPDSKFNVIDHFKKQPTGNERSILSEAGRIARTEITDISKISAADLDGLIFPGGFGAASNLCDWATKGSECEVDKDVERLILDMHKAKKPLGLICIAPVLGARLLGKFGVSLTIGNDKNTALAIESCGAKHVDCKVHQAIADEDHLVASTPAYMLGPSISHIAKGIEQLVKTVVGWAE